MTYVKDGARGLSLRSLVHKPQDQWFEVSII